MSSVIVKKDLFDRNASLYVIGCLMKRPLLLQEERYAFVSTDFDVPLHQMVFFAIYNLAQNGVVKITPQDIDLYLKQYSAQYKYYETHNGFSLVMQCSDMIQDSDDKQFDYYYQRLKKFSMLRDFENVGIDTSQFYDTEKDALNRDLEDEKLNKTSLNAIPERIRSLIVDIENRHIGKDTSTSQVVGKGIRQLVADLREQPEVGLPLDGDIINFAARGARLGKLYTYSAPSGAGKALPNSTLIPMADGSWKTVGEVRPGDLLIDRLGKPTRILQIFPQGKKDIWQITFKDGRTAKCNDEHLWTVYDINCGFKPKTMTLKELVDGFNEYVFPLSSAIQKDLSFGNEYCDINKRLLLLEQIFKGGNKVCCLNKKDAAYVKRLCWSLGKFVMSDENGFINIIEDARYTHAIKIEKLNEVEEMTCFLVDNEEHLFLMNDYIVTHNTRYMVGNACAISMPYIDDRGKVVVRGNENSDDDNYQKVLFVTTEQQADEIQTMILAYVSGVNEKHILLGNYTPDQYDRVQKALDIVERYQDNFIIECIPDPSIAMIKARLAKYIVQDGVEYIFYDYIFSSPGLLSEFRDVAVREDVALMMLSNSLKETAMIYNVFIQSATQLNEGWSKKTTGLRDQNCLRGSKAIADCKF